jgi:hypothetical protein
MSNESYAYIENIITKPDTLAGIELRIRGGCFPTHYNTCGDCVQTFLEVLNL